MASLRISFEGIKSTGYGKFILLSAITAPLSVAATALLSLAIDGVFVFDSIPPNSVAEAAENGVTWARALSALALAPLIENLLCLLWVFGLVGWKTNAWWVKPALVAAIAALFHSILYLDVRPFAVFPGFFLMCCMMANYQSRVVGFWGSVLHHFCINAINLGLIFIG